jgi:hypothetical protein
MKLESYILRYGTKEDLIAEGHAIEAVRAILALPPEIRGLVVGVTPCIQQIYNRFSLENQTYPVDIETERGAFVYSRPDGTLVPRHLAQYSTFKFVLWQANIFFRTGYWMEPSTSRSLTVGTWHPPKERARVVAVISAAPFVVPAIIIVDVLKEKASILVNVLGKGKRK